MSEHHLHPAPQDTASFEAAAQQIPERPDARAPVFILCHSEKMRDPAFRMYGDVLARAVAPPAPLRAAGLIVARREVYYRAADTVEAQLFHKMIEQVLEIACPG